MSLEKSDARFRCIATSSPDDFRDIGQSRDRSAARYGVSCVKSSILKTPLPPTMQRIVPSGTLIMRWIVPIVPTRRTSPGPGSSVSLSMRATRPIGRPSRSASSTSAMPGFFTTASGMTVLGNSTASCSGKIPRTPDFSSSGLVFVRRLLRGGSHQARVLRTVMRISVRRAGMQRMFGNGEADRQRIPSR